MSYIGNLKHLCSLSFGWKIGQFISIEGWDVIFEAFSQLESLEELVLSDAFISSRGCSFLHQLSPSLRKLKLQRTGFKNDTNTLTLLSNFDNLEMLTLGELDFTLEVDVEEEEKLSMLPKLRELRIVDCTSLKIDTFKGLFSKCKESLEILEIRECSFFLFVGWMMFLLPLRNLVKLTLSLTDLDSDEWKREQRFLKNAEFVGIQEIELEIQGCCMEESERFSKRSYS